MEYFVYQIGRIKMPSVIESNGQWIFLFSFFGFLIQLDRKIWGDIYQNVNVQGRLGGSVG